MPDEDMFNPSEHSDFNAGVATLERCHNIKTFMDADTMNEDYVSLFRRLKAFFKELHPILNSKEKTTAAESYHDCRKIYNKLKAKEAVSEEDIDSIDEWELELRGYEQAHKMNMPMGRDSRWALSTRR